MDLKAVINANGTSHDDSANGRLELIHLSIPRPLAGDSLSNQSIDKCIFVDGAYELRFLQVIERFFRRKPHAVMLDIGAK